MKRAGQIALTPVPNTDLSGTKRRPVLLIRRASSHFDDWLVCMVSSQLHQAETGFDEFLTPQDTDFENTGLKAPSVLRLSRLAVLDGSLLIGSIGAISDKRLQKKRKRPSKMWLGRLMIWLHRMKWNPASSPNSATTSSPNCFRAGCE